MMTELHVAYRETDDLPEPYVACLELRQPDLDSPEPVDITLYLTTGYPLELLREWLQMRIDTLLTDGFARDEWNDPFQDGDDWVIRTWVKVHAVPKL